MPTLPASSWPAIVLLAASALTLLSGRQRYGLSLLAATVPVALWGGWITLPALAPLAMAALLLYWQQHRPGSIQQWLLLLLALLLGLHLLPGFTSLPLWQGQLAADSSSFLLRWQLNKAIAGCLLLLYPEWRPPCGQRWPQLLLAILLLALAASAALWLELVRIDIKWPLWWPYWLAGNLLLTCLAEEALFRRTLPQLLPARWHALARMLLCSLLFGLAYALVYRAGGRLGWPILAHAAFNSLHLALLSYPQLQ